LETNWKEHPEWDEFKRYEYFVNKDKLYARFAKVYEGTFAKMMKEQNFDFGMYQQMLQQKLKFENYGYDAHTINSLGKQQIINDGKKC
jgi:hypothetical protein